MCIVFGLKTVHQRAIRALLCVVHSNNKLYTCMHPTDGSMPFIASKSVQHVWVKKVKIFVVRRGEGGGGGKEGEMKIFWGRGCILLLCRKGK